MKIALISTITPTSTNVGGPSALPYQLIKYRPSYINIELYSFNENKISQEKISKISNELRCNIHLIQYSKKFTLIQQKVIRNIINRFYFLPIKSLQTSSNILYTQLEKFDYIWIYPHILYHLSLPINKKIIITGPDSAALHYYRALKDQYVYDNNLTKIYKRVYKKFLALEHEWGKKANTTLHFVGESDQNFYSTNFGKNSFYLPHPYNNIPSFSQKRIKKDNKLSIIITGEFNIYTYTDTLEIIKCLCKFSELNKYFKFTFLGKHWENNVENLIKSGYEAQQIRWVEDYYKELQNHDIQLFPISVGTGTKGKVLDALCTKILCIGSLYAFENINIENGKTGFKYESPNEVINILYSIKHNPELINVIGENGFLLVQKEHSPQKISQIFFSKFE